MRRTTSPARRRKGSLLLPLLIGCALHGPLAAAPPLGSTPDADGTTFRVWAPHGTSVFVSGTFNGWSEDADPLTPGPDGYWSGRVAGAHVGDEYRYVIHSDDGDVVTRRDPAGRKVTNSAYGVGKTIIYDAHAFDWGRDTDFHRPALGGLVIYEMHVGTFNAPRAGEPGNFADAIARLDHVQALGATAVEVLPVNESPGRFFTGYGPAEQFAVEKQAYGGPDGFKAFVKAAHARGLAVILDVVHNHWGPWDLETNQFDGWHTADYTGGIYFYDSTRIDSPWGPRPDYRRPEVRRFILESLAAWVDEDHVDGFRWDSTSNIDHTDSGQGLALPEGWSLMQQANQLQRRRAPGTYAIAEDLLNRATITAPVKAGGAGFDTQWHYFASPVREVLTAPTDAQRHLSLVTGAITSLYNGQALQRVIFSESHNEASPPGERLTVAIDPTDPFSWRARKLSTLGAALAFTSPGIPMIWQGQEFLDPAAFDPRQPLDWSNLDRYPGIDTLYHDLVALDLDRGGLCAGLRGNNVRVFLQDNATKLMAYHRWQSGGPGDDVVVVANFSEQPAQGAIVGFPSRGTWTARFNSDDVRYSPDYGGAGSAQVQADGPARQGMAASGRVDVAPYSVVVFSQSP
jgi:1,4-alpha-glucan branching enzyme